MACLKLCSSSLRVSLSGRRSGSNALLAVRNQLTYNMVIPSERLNRSPLTKPFSLLFQSLFHVHLITLFPLISSCGAVAAVIAPSSNFKDNRTS